MNKIEFFVLKSLYYCGVKMKFEVVCRKALFLRGSRTTPKSPETMPLIALVNPIISHILTIIHFYMCNNNNKYFRRNSKYYFCTNE